MELKITWETPEEFLGKIAQVFYLASYGHRDSLNQRLESLHGDKPFELDPKQETKAEESVKETKKATPAKTKAKKETVAEETPEPELKEEEAAPWDDVTDVTSMDELRQAFVSKNTPKNRPQLKAILAELGATKITELPEESWAVAMTKLEEL